MEIQFPVSLLAHINYIFSFQEVFSGSQRHILSNLKFWEMGSHLPKSLSDPGKSLGRQIWGSLLSKCLLKFVGWRTWRRRRLSGWNPIYRPAPAGKNSGSDVTGPVTAICIYTSVPWRQSYNWPQVQSVSCACVTSSLDDAIARQGYVTRFGSSVLTRVQG